MKSISGQLNTCRSELLFAAVLLPFHNARFMLSVSLGNSKTGPAIDDHEVTALLFSGVALDAR